MYTRWKLLARNLKLTNLLSDNWFLIALCKKYTQFFYKTYFAQMFLIDVNETHLRRTECDFKPFCANFFIEVNETHLRRTDVRLQTVCLN